MSEEKVKLGPKVLSKKNITDQFINFSISVGEIQNLPSNYEESELIKYSLKVGDLVLMDNQSVVKDLDKNITLDDKDISNFLNQNTNTVIKQLRVNDLSKKDLNKLLNAERQRKKRKKIIDFIKTLNKVI